MSQIGTVDPNYAGLAQKMSSAADAAGQLEQIRKLWEAVGTSQAGRSNPYDATGPKRSYTRNQNMLANQQELEDATQGLEALTPENGGKLLGSILQSAESLAETGRQIRNHNYNPQRLKDFLEDLSYKLVSIAAGETPFSMADSYYPGWYYTPALARSQEGYSIYGGINLSGTHWSEPLTLNTETLVMNFYGVIEVVKLKYMPETTSGTSGGKLENTVHTVTSFRKGINSHYYYPPDYALVRLLTNLEAGLAASAQMAQNQLEVTVKMADVFNNLGNVLKIEQRLTAM